MAKKFMSGIDLVNQELVNFRVQHGETFPSSTNQLSPLDGRLAYDSIENVLRLGIDTGKTDSSGNPDIRWATLLDNYHVNLDELDNYAPLVGADMTAVKVKPLITNGATYPGSEGAAIVVQSAFGDPSLYKEENAPRIGFVWRRMTSSSNAQLLFYNGAFSFRDDGMKGYASLNCGYLSAYNGAYIQGGLSVVKSAQGYGGGISAAGIISATGGIDSGDYVRGVKIMVHGGTSSQFLKADGTLDSNKYSEILQGKFIYNGEDIDSVGTTSIKSELGLWEIEGDYYPIARYNTAADGEEPRYIYFDRWSIDENGKSNTDYEKVGTCICVEGKMFRCNASKKFVEIMSGLSADNQQKLDSCYTALFEDEQSATKYIDKWSEIKAFLDGFDNTQDLSGIISGIHTDIGHLQSRATNAETRITQLTGLVSARIKKDDLTVNGATPDMAQIFAPTTAGYEEQMLVSAGAGNAPIWKDYKTFVILECDENNTYKTLPFPVGKSPDVIVRVYEKLSEVEYEEVIVDIKLQYDEGKEMWYMVLDFAEAPKNQTFRIVVMK